MALPENLLPTYGYLLLLAWVLVEQLGIPLPAAPALLAAGALSAQHELSFAFALLAGLTGSLIADSAWFLIGRKYGHLVLRLLCKLSFEPAVCVRRTREAFVRHRALTLLIAKFVPGLGTLASPIAAQSGLGFGFIHPFRHSWFCALARFASDCRALLWRLAQARSPSAGLGGQVFRGFAGPGDSWAHRLARHSPAHDSQTTICRAPGA